MSSRHGGTVLMGQNVSSFLGQWQRWMVQCQVGITCANLLTLLLGCQAGAKCCSAHVLFSKVPFAQWSSKVGWDQSAGDLWSVVAAHLPAYHHFWRHPTPSPAHQWTLRSVKLLMGAGACLADDGNLITLKGCVSRELLPIMASSMWWAGQFQLISRRYFLISR